jgi:hypothetical protein
MNALVSNNLLSIPLSSISLDFANTRRKIKDEDIETLRSSMGSVGLVVSKNDDNQYTLIAGFTRFEVIKLLGCLKRLATQVGGDYEEVGARLVLTPKQLSDRLALAACVLTQIRSYKH